MAEASAVFAASSLPPAALGMTASWALAHEVARWKLTSAWGTEDVWGMPRWRSAVGLVTQWVALPLLLLCALLSPAWSETRTCDPAYGVFEWSFCLIFPLFLVADFIELRMGKMLTLHHVVCLVGHVGSVTLSAAAFPYYFTGVVCLELGGSASSSHVLWPQRVSPLAVRMLMTASNLSAAAAVAGWALVAMRTNALWAACGSLACLILIAMRQKETLSSLANDPIPVRKPDGGKTDGRPTPLM